MHSHGKRFLNGILSQLSFSHRKAFVVTEDVTWHLLVIRDTRTLLMVHAGHPCLGVLGT